MEKNKLAKEENIFLNTRKSFNVASQRHVSRFLDNGHTVKAVAAGRLRKNRIRILQGDRVKVAISPYDFQGERDFRG